MHQDLRPDNILIAADGAARIIDLGSAKAAGIEEMALDGGGAQPMLGTAQYAAPEYFLGEPGTPRSDLYSLAAMLYQMLSGRLPYGPDAARARSRAAQLRLRYAPVREPDSEYPAWIDGVLSRALHPDPRSRTSELSEFTHALRHPEDSFHGGERLPLLDRNPLAFWKGLSLILAIALAAVALYP